MKRFAALTALVLACGLGPGVVAAEPPAPSAATIKALAEIGTWDGKTTSAELAGPYEDPRQTEVPFGQKSYYLAPWRGWMDTWPARRFLESLGINFNVSPSDADAVATVLAEAGIRSARVEVGMGNFRYDDPAQLSDPAGVRRKLEALKRCGIRPLILLNANSGWPCPIRTVRVRLLNDAAEGSRQIVVDKTADLRPHYTGLRGMAYQVAFPLITQVDAATGRCELSAPLPKPLKAGTLELCTLKYPPLSAETLADGSPNPAAKETLDGWMTYVAAVCRFAKDVLGTAGASDAGFDLEVWNELTFGSHYLDDKQYYNPPREYRKPRFRYKDKEFGYEVLLAMTVDYVCDPASGLPGVRVIDGFSNQRPWESGSSMWPGQAGFSRHYYCGLAPHEPFQGTQGLLSPETDRSRRHSVLDAAGRPEGRTEKGEAVPGTYFVPVVRIACPETWFYGYKTEMISRDLQPWPNGMKGHGRYSHPGTGRHAEVWQTEFNIDRQPWADWLVGQGAAEKGDPRLAALMHHVGAKALLRTFFFYSHKGLATLDVFAARDRDTSLAVIPQAFYAELKRSGGVLTEAARGLVGPQLAAVGRAARSMNTGRAVDVTRPLAVARLVEEKPRLVFRGDSTPAHPDRWHRDDFACLPFQLDAGRFVVACYVVTRNIVHEWDTARDRLDPSRYDMPEQTFRLTLSNVRGQGAKVSAYDPLTDRSTEARVLDATATTVTVAMAATDCPRLLIIEEAGPGPLIMSPRLMVGTDGAATLAFATNVPVTPRVTWGPFPRREGVGSASPAAGSRFSVPLPGLEKGQAVRLTIEHEGLRTVWPRWDHDTDAVRWQ